MHLGTVVNVNFPVGTASDTPIIDTFPAKLQWQLIRRNRPGKFTFATRTALSPTPIHIPTAPCLKADGLVVAYWISRGLENETNLKRSDYSGKELCRMTQNYGLNE